MKGQLKMHANLFNIQRFSLFDGPGVRTAVFFKGCNLRCRWCHNPESFLMDRQLCYDKTKCIGCNQCIKNCPGNFLFRNAEKELVIQKENCSNCGYCATRCYAKALSIIGKKVTPDELMKEILEDVPYYRQSKNGGVTFSGGECMLQIDFLEEIVRRCQKENIHTAVDTAGNVPYEFFERIRLFTNCFLYDMKAFQEEVHRELTGVSNKKIIENLVRLKEDGANITIRIPVIPSLNEQELPLIREFLYKHHIQDVELLPYHNMGVGKGELLLNHTMQEQFREPTDTQMNHYKELFGITANKKENTLWKK